MRALGELAPLFSQIVADGDKRQRPNQAAHVGKKGEFGDLEFCGTGNVGRQVTDTRYKVAKREGPSTDPVKPLMHAVNVGVRDPEPRPIVDEQVCAECASEDIADRDAAAAP